MGEKDKKQEVKLPAHRAGHPADLPVTDDQFNSDREGPEWMQ
jgi:hypothetical protein